MSVSLSYWLGRHGQLQPGEGPVECDHSGRCSCVQSRLTLLWGCRGEWKAALMEQCLLLFRSSRSPLPGREAGALLSCGGRPPGQFAAHRLCPARPGLPPKASSPTKRQVLVNQATSGALHGCLIGWRNSALRLPAFQGTGMPEIPWTSKKGSLVFIVKMLIKHLLNLPLPFHPHHSPLAKLPFVLIIC